MSGAFVSGPYPEAAEAGEGPSAPVCSLRVDLATILSFMTAPALAVLNHRAIHGPEVPKEMQPRRWLTMLSWAGIAFSSLLAADFVWVRFVRPG